MFTPQRRALPALVLSPRNESNELRSNARGVDKGKAVAFFDGPPPPLSTLGVNEEEKTMLGLDTGDMKDWRRFREAGLLDEATLESKNLEALVEKVSKLQNELFNYQHSMGLLLLEKKEWTSKNEDIEQELAETEEIIKREHSTHLMLLSEAEKREENKRKALASERQCVAELEKALRCVDKEHAENKLAYEKKVVDSNALGLQLEEKSLVVEEKLCAAEAKLGEVNRKSAEIELKMHEIDTRQSLLQRERMSLCKEQESWKKNFYKEREELRRLEQNLQYREESLCQNQKIFSDRDQKINENDGLVKQKEMRLEEAEKNIDLSRSSLIAKEDEINRKLADLEVKEKEADSLRSLLEMKQKNLLVLQEKLSRRERVDIEILLDNQRDILRRKEEEFKLEWEEKRRALDKELNERVHGIAQTEAEMNHQAEKLVKREQALDEKSNRVKTKEKSLEVKLNTLMEKEKAMNAEDKKLETERQKMLADRENLDSLLEAVDKLRAEITHLEQQVDDERKKLGLVREERSEYMHLQLELKQEIGKYRVQKDLLLKEGNNLKQDREMFEKEWVLLDEKRTEVSKEMRSLDEEREQVEKLRHGVHERKKRENDLLQDYVQKEFDDLKLQKESFEANMKHEHLALSEKAESERKIMIHDFEEQRNNLEAQLRNRKKEGDRMRQERDKALEEEKERKKINIQRLKDIVQREREDLISERYQIEKEKKMAVLDRKHLKADQLEINEDIDKLDKLSKKLKDQRKCLIQERGDFLNFFEKFKNCEYCGGKVEEFTLNDIQLHEIEDQAAIRLPLMANGNLAAPNLKSGGEMSWIRKCTSRIFNLSPGKRLGDVPKVPLESSSGQVKAEIQVQGPSVLVNDGVTGLGPQITSVISSKTIDSEGIVSNNEMGEMDNEYFPSTDDGSFLPSGKDDEVPEVSQLSELRSTPGKGKERRKYNSGLNRTRSVKAVVEDAKVFLGENPESPGPSNFIEKKDGNTARKRQHAQTFSVTENEPDSGNGENFPGSVADGGRRKRRQTMTPSRPTPGQTRYNLRRTRPQPSTEMTNVGEKEGDGCTTNIAREQNDVSIPSPDSQGKNAQTLDMVATTVVNSVEDNTELRDNLTENEEEEEEVEIAIQEDEEEYDDLEQIDDDPPTITKKIWTFFTTLGKKRGRRTAENDISAILGGLAAAGARPCSVALPPAGSTHNCGGRVRVWYKS